MDKQPLIAMKDLCVEIEGKPLLKGVNLEIFPGEIHAIMGPNGAGKSTLAKVIAGHPAYTITGGDILLQGTSLLELEPHERALLGVFMSFQYPLEIPGVSNLQFLQLAVASRRKALKLPPLSEEEFRQFVEEKMAMLEMKSSFLERNLNEGFSGGEKKRNEILQMALLEPKVAILDETDSGLDIDALRIVAKGVEKLKTEKMGLILITHYQRLLDLIQPDVVHIFVDGNIVQSGGPSLALELEKSGYEGLSGMRGVA